MLFNKLIANIMKGVREKGIVLYGIVRFLMFISGILKKCGIKVGKKLFGKMILDKANLSSIRICISGGGPLPASTFRMFNQLGLDFVQGYGSHREVKNANGLGVEDICREVKIFCKDV